MRVRLNSKLIAALLAPALLVSSTGQGLLFRRCESLLRMSCCCPTETPAAPGNTLTQRARQSCDKISVPSIPSQNVERVIPIVSAPVLVAVLGPSTSARSVVGETRQVSRLDPLPGPSPVLANYALLI